MTWGTADHIARLAWTIAPWALVLARTLGLAWTAPALATPGLGGRMRLALALALTALLVPVVGPDLPTLLTPLSLLPALLAEILVGAGLGWSAALVIAGARQAGEVVGSQAGLSPAALFDPEAGDEMTALGHLYGLVALGVFLTLDGPLELTRALAESFRVIPAGGLAITSDTATRACARIGWALTLALRAAAPAGVALAMAGLALGLLGRAAPSLSLVTLVLPARVILGLGLALIGLVTLVITLTAAWHGSFPWGGWTVSPFG